MTRTALNESEEKSRSQNSGNVLWFEEVLERNFQKRGNCNKFNISKLEFIKFKSHLLETFKLVFENFKKDFYVYRFSCFKGRSKKMSWNAQDQGPSNIALLAL